MTERMIKIGSCQKCPHFDHKGAFGEIAYVPFCRATKATLPHTLSAVKGRVYASYDGTIPASCPLEKYPEAINSGQPNTIGVVK